MKKKIVSILVLTLLIATIISMPVFANKPTIDISSKDSFFDIFIEANTFSLGTRIIITNIGDETITDIEWTFDASGGTIIFGDGEHGNIPTSMAAEDVLTLIIYPAPGLFPDADGQSPIGVGAITMTAMVQGTVGSTLTGESTTKNAFLLGPFILMSPI